MTTVKLVFSLECGAGAKPQPGPVHQLAALPRKERLAVWRWEALRNPLRIKLNMFFCVNTVTEKETKMAETFSVLFCQEDENKILLCDLSEVLGPAE